MLIHVNGTPIKTRGEGVAAAALSRRCNLSRQCLRTLLWILTRPRVQSKRRAASPSKCSSALGVFAFPPSVHESARRTSRRFTLVNGVESPNWPLYAAVLESRASITCPMVMRDGTACGFMMISGTMPNLRARHLFLLSSEGPMAKSSGLSLRRPLRSKAVSKSKKIEKKIRRGTLRTRSPPRCALRVRHVLLAVHDAHGPLLPVARRKPEAQLPKRFEGD